MIGYINFNQLADLIINSYYLMSSLTSAIVCVIAMSRVTLYRSANAKVLRIVSRQTKATFCDFDYMLIFYFTVEFKHGMYSEGHNC